jgi:protease PrsW
MPARLVLIVDQRGQPPREFLLESGQLVLGRDDAAEVHFGPEITQVSRRHAIIAATLTGFRIKDERSTNGTWINQRRVEEAELRGGELIRLGLDGPSLRVRIDAPEAPRVQPARPQRRMDTIANARLYDPERDKGRRYNYLGIALIVGMLSLGGALGLLVGLMSVFELGPGAAFVGVFVAFMAAPFYLAIWLWLDRYDPEPIWILAGALVWGAGAATFVSGFVNTAFTRVMFSITHHAGLANFLSASISAPVVEELAKGLAVLLIFFLWRREFDGVLDGIVYAGVVALGFATVENVLYYGRQVAKEGLGGLVVIFAVRGILGPFGHAVFTSMTGVGCGLARQSHNTAVRVLAPILGFAGAMILHFLWNTLAAFSGGMGGFLVIYVVVWAPLFLLFFILVIAMGFREARLIRRMLELEVVRGLLSSAQADTVCSWVKRTGWLLSALARPQVFSARRHFLHAATRLALSYWHAERAAVAGGETLSAGQIPGYRGEVERLRLLV